MRLATAKFLSAGLAIAALAAALTLTGAHAQSMGGSGFGGGGGGIGGGRKHQQKSTDKTAEQKPKVDEKAYAAALKGLPNRPYDPWHGVR